MDENNQTMIDVTLRGGLDIWGVEFIQWLEQQLDHIPGLERVGKSVMDDSVSIHMKTKTVFYQNGKLWCE